MPEAGQRSAQILANSTLVSVDNEDSHGLFPYGTTCVDDTVLDYFIDGELPTDNIACQALPLPLETETFEVAGEVGNKGKIKLKMRTDAVKEANEIFKEILADNAAGN